MRSLLLRARPPDQEALVTALWQHGTIGIIEEPESLRAFFEETDEIENVLNFFANHTIEVRTEVSPDPADFPKENWDPILVGARFFIAPSWVHQPTPPGRMRLTVDSLNAFGTGRHESTQLAIEALEARTRGTDTVLDIGSGSGILSQAALLLGIRRVFSCDIQMDAMLSSKSQLQSRLFLGSADAIRSQTGDIVLANISARVVDALAWELRRVTKPDGLIILSGFVRDNRPTHFKPEHVTERGDWLCWVCRPQAISVSAERPICNTHSPQWW